MALDCTPPFSGSLPARKLPPADESRLPLHVQEVSSRAQLRRFIDLPYGLYRKHPCWVPPLRADVKSQLSPHKHPYYRHAAHRLFLATQNGRDMGRMAVFHNRKHNQVYKVNIGMFGYLDMVDDVAVTAALMDAAAQWLEQYGATHIQGPYSPDINGTVGVLLDAYNAPPMLLMPYNYPYYPQHLDQLGFLKAKDLWAYQLDENDALPQRLLDFGEAMEARGRFIIREINMRRFWDDVVLVRDIYNQAWVENWGALWMDDDEFTHIAKDLKLLMDPQFSYIAEVQGKVAGFSLSLPNINEALARLPNGRLFPLGLFKLLWHKRRISSLRVFTMGVLKPYRRLGIDAAFYLRTFRTAVAKSYRLAEASWILEDNAPMNHALQKVGARKVKTYRIYRRPLAGPSPG